MSEQKNAQRERMLKKQKQMREALPGQLALIAGLIVGALAVQVIVALFSLMLS